MKNTYIILLLYSFLSSVVTNAMPINNNRENQKFSLSVVIPLGPGENISKSLVEGLNTLPNNTEIIFVTNAQTSSDLKMPVLKQQRTHMLIADPGRAEHMNAGARRALGEYIWFLHADSKFADNTSLALLNELQSHPKSLLFFDLAFINDVTPLMQINEWGAYFRSRVLGVPFGDQGFCINRKLFNALGGFPEKLPYGEDHVFVWKARQQGINLKPLPATLYTSSRKYKKYGWFRTTILTQYLWIKQAIPEWKKLS